MDKNKIEEIRLLIKEMQGNKRYNHTLGVEEEAYRLGEIFIPSECERLALAGLLHDITKKLTTEEHLELCDKYKIDVNKDIAPKLLHAKTGCEFAKQKFGTEIVDDQIYTAILYHTTGKSGMNIFESLIYLADYIEPTRTFGDCKKLRKYFYKNLKKKKEDKFEVLRKTLIMSFDMTIKNLIDENKQIDKDTIETRNFFIKNKSCFAKI
ncbi:MAG: bis(5'-nucleosyl)-tetraphosphatase (symmetrical) YqeK [Clostridia bacterium]|nr:bis(5'-nucleosyl)-tetraphosphatase (symmetrical) YqeK [Clostridia bacterium]